MKEGFDLCTASKELRAVAAASGIKSGRCVPVNSGPVDACEDDEVVAIVFNSRKRVEIKAWELQYAIQYLI